MANGSGLPAYRGSAEPRLLVPKGTVRVGTNKTLTYEEDLYEGKTASAILAGVDGVSAMDYGQLAVIPGKGRALHRMAVKNFRIMQAMRINTHFVEEIDDTKMRIRAVPVYQNPEERAGGPGFIALEVLWRGAIAPKASVLKKENYAAALKRYGLSEFKAGYLFDTGAIDWSTKLESTGDRLIDAEEAMKIGGIDAARLAQMAGVTRETMGMVSYRAARTGTFHPDGKLEFAFLEGGKLVVVDVAGTLDEDRFVLITDKDRFKNIGTELGKKKWVNVSKQIIRDILQESDWHPKWKEQKKAGVPKEQQLRPPELPDEFLDSLGTMYDEFSRAYVEGREFDDTVLDPIDEMLPRVSAAVK